MLRWDTELCDLVNWLAISAPLLPLWKGSSLYGNTAVPHPSMHQIKGRTAAAEHDGKFSKPSTFFFWLNPEVGHICFDGISQEVFLPHWRVTSGNTTWHMDYYIVHLMACIKMKQWSVSKNTQSIRTALMIHVQFSKPLSLSLSIIRTNINLLSVRTMWGGWVSDSQRALHHIPGPISLNIHSYTTREDPLRDGCYIPQHSMLFLTKYTGSCQWSFYKVKNYMHLNWQNVASKLLKSLMF